MEENKFEGFDKFGVTDPEELEMARAFIEASDISLAGYEKLKFLPDTAIKQIIQMRYRKTAAQLVLCQGNPVDAGLTQKLLTDMTLIEFCANQKNIPLEESEDEFDSNLILGREVATDIFGLMDAYKHALELGRVNPAFYHYEKEIQQVENMFDPDTGRPIRAFDLVQNMKDKLLERKNEISNERSR